MENEDVVGDARRVYQAVRQYANALLWNDSRNADIFACLGENSTVLVKAAPYGASLLARVLTAVSSQTNVETCWDFSGTYQDSATKRSRALLP